MWSSVCNSHSDSSQSQHPCSNLLCGLVAVALQLERHVLEHELVVAVTVEQNLEGVSVLAVVTALAYLRVVAHVSQLLDVVQVWTIQLFFGKGVRVS